MSSSAHVLKFGARTRLLVVAPHPDDETIGTGELIQEVRHSGGSVRVLLLTDGDNNPWPQRWLERRARIRPQDRARWGCRRREEVSRALHTLGVHADALRPMGWPDMGLTARLHADMPDLLAALAAELDDYRPTLIALPALGDRHPDHGTAHVLIRLALARSSFDTPVLLNYLVHGHSHVDDAAVELTSDPPQRETKLVALETHRSQMALSSSRMRRLCDRAERYAVGATRMDNPATRGTLPWQPPALLVHWLRILVVDSRGARCWRWSDAPITRDPNGCYRWKGTLPERSEGANGRVFAKLFMDVPSPWIFDHWGWCEW